MTNVSQFAKTRDQALTREYKFWDTQPVPKLKELISANGPIEMDKKIESDQLPEGFEWTQLDLRESQPLQELTDFLDKYYIQDHKSEFKLHYSSDFIKWYLVADKYRPEMSLGIRVIKSKLLVGIICGKIVRMQVHKNQIDMPEINFLCVHPKLRSKRMSPVLIREMTRQFNSLGYQQAIFTDERYLPTPIATVRFHHRALNINVLLETGFSKLQNKVTISGVKKAIKLPEDPINKNFKKLEVRHLEQAYKIFNTYMERYSVHPIFDFQEFEALFLNNKFVTCYVLEDDNENVIDMVSYYILNLDVLKNNDKYQIIRQAYLFYYTSLLETPYRLIKDLLIIARNNSIDVFTATDIMEHIITLQDLIFESGTGVLHYYFYNWRCKPINNTELAKILF
jgi:glycylpeptide N-tetradecanoyltransferase